MLLRPCGEGRQSLVKFTTAMKSTESWMGCGRCTQLLRSGPDGRQSMWRAPEAFMACPRERTAAKMVTEAWCMRGGYKGRGPGGRAVVGGVKAI